MKHRQADKKFSILIVDDSPVLLDVLSQKLEDMAYDIHTALSGEKALALLTTFMPDAILLDVEMPGIGGFATCEAIRQLPNGKYIPIMMVTGLGDMKSIKRAYQAGATDFETKPINFDNIGNRVQYLIRTSLDFQELQQMKQELYQLNSELEDRVQARTEQITQANEVLKRTLETLQTTQEQLIESEKLASLGALVAGVAHEINTPVGICVTGISCLKQDIASLINHFSSKELTQSMLQQFLAESEETTSLVEKNLQRAIHIIKSFKETSADQLSEDQRVINLNEYLEEIIVSVNPVLKKRKLTVEISCPKDLMLYTYPGLLFRVMTILIMNSITHGFSPDQTGTLSIHVTLENEKTIIRYSDTGQGISPDNIKKIFDPFFTTKRGSGSTGLGLHIAYNSITQIMGGTIDCSSELGQGVLFTIILNNLSS